MHSKSEAQAKDLAYVLAMEDVVLVPEDWASLGSAWCRCSGTMGRTREAGSWCEHVAALFCELADVCDDDSFFIYQMRGVRLARQSKAGSKRAVVDLVGSDSPSPPRHRVAHVAGCGSSSQPVLCDSDGDA